MTGFTLPTVLFKGPHDTDASLLLGAADKLERGFTPGGSNVTTAPAAAPAATDPGSRGIVRFAFGVLAVIGAIIAGWLLFVALRFLVRRREEAKEARRRLDAAFRKLSSAQSDATAAVLESGVESAKIRAASFAEKAESTVDLSAFTRLLSRRDELSGEFNRRSADPTPTTEAEVLNQVATLTRITEDLRTVNSDADKLADDAEAKAASCTPECKRSDVQTEIERLEQQIEATSVDGVDLSDQRAVVESKHAELVALAESITAANAPTRAAVDAALRESAAVRSTAAQKVSRANEVIGDLHRIGGQASRIAEQYGKDVPGVSSDAAERAIAAAFEVAHAADAVKGSIPATGAQLATLAPQVDELISALRAATDEVARQVAEYRAAERRRAEKERKERQKDQEEANRRRARARSSSYGSSYGSDYASGLATGAILGSSSSSSSSSYDYGGGSSGGWDSGSSFGGGGDFGGGSSGGW